MTKKRVVITGAAGYVAQRMLDELRAKFAAAAPCRVFTSST